jgi:hypothetical protein
VFGLETKWVGSIPVDPGSFDPSKMRGRSEPTSHPSRSVSLHPTRSLQHPGAGTDGSMEPEQGKCSAARAIRQCGRTGGAAEQGPAVAGSRARASRAGPGPAAATGAARVTRGKVSGSRGAAERGVRTGGAAGQRPAVADGAARVSRCGARGNRDEPWPAAEQGASSSWGQPRQAAPRGSEVGARRSRRRSRGQAAAGVNRGRRRDSGRGALGSGRVGTRERCEWSHEEGDKAQKK